MHDFTGTRLWLAKWIINENMIDTVIAKIRNVGAVCDCEILSNVKGKVNGGTILFEL
jgi:hypothetical protein